MIPSLQLAAYEPEPMAGQDRGACRGVDPDVFFPGPKQNARAAKKICAECDAKAIADHALDVDGVDVQHQRVGQALREHHVGPVGEHQRLAEALARMLAPHAGGKLPDKLRAQQILNENQAAKERQDFLERQLAEERQSLAIIGTWQEAMKLTPTNYNR